MRAEIAGYFKGGHPFSDGYTSLNETQIYILYKHVVEKQTEKKRDLLDTLKSVIEIGFKKMDALFDSVLAFINPKAFERLLEARKIDSSKLENDINEDNFLEEWDKILSSIPEEIIVEDSTYVHEKLLKEIPTPELDAQIAQWTTGIKSRKKRKGEANGNE